jgi:tetratricopeptide (TPR) repeat protein/TolB-like protein
MRSLSKLLALSLNISLIALSATFVPLEAASAQTPADSGGRIILVLPFENHSGNPSLSWIGDSFPDTLDKRLNSAGFLTISHDDRVFALDHLGLPADFRPSRATTIRIAQQLDANYVVIGSFSVTGDPAKERISIQSRVLSVDQLKLSPPVEDSSELSRLFDAENAIAWKVSRVVDPKLTVSEQTFLAASGSVPLPAFEDYIRGTNASAPTERLKRLQEAVTVVPDYATALLALGKEQYAERDYEAAATTLAKVPHKDRLALEANFYLGLARFNSAKYAAAQEAFAFVATSLPLSEVVNDEGVALGRQGKDGVEFFQRASAADPSDEDYHYNLAIALYRRGDVAGAFRESETALKLKPADNEAIQLHTLLKSVPAGSKLTASNGAGFSPVERIRRNYSEAGFRQAAFQLDQLRAARMAILTPTKRATEYTQLGRDYLAQGLLPEAETQFQSALEADPNSPDAHAGLAQLAEASGDPVKARDEAQTSVILGPNATAYLVLARLDMADKQFDKSATDVSNALHVEPLNAQAIALRLVIQQQGQAVK